MSNVPRPHILYVEDNASMRTLMAIRLAQAGCEGALSEDFSSAKQIIESGRPIHGVISDGVYRGEGAYPYLGSLCLLRLMHQRRLTIPVIIATSQPDFLIEQLREFAASPDMKGFKTPPVVTKADFKAIVHDLLQAIAAQAAQRPDHHGGGVTGAPLRGSDPP